MRRSIIVVGGGPAGLAAAAFLADHGGEVMVFEREAEPGGASRHCAHRGFGIAEFRRLCDGPDYARRLAGAAAHAQLRTGVTVTRLLPRGAVEILGRSGIETVQADRVLLATGTRESPRSARLIGGARPWGVLNTGALQQLVHLKGIRPFHRPVILGTELVSFSALLTLRRAGGRAVAMIEEEGRIVAPRPADWIARLAFGTPVWLRTRLVAILGQVRVEAVEVEHEGHRRLVDCDGVVVSGRFVPDAALLIGGPLAVDGRTGGPLIDQFQRCSDPTYFAAGNVLRGVEPSWRCHAEGIAAAQAMLAHLPEGPTVAIRAGPGVRNVVPQRCIVGHAPVTVAVRVEAPTRGALVARSDDGQVVARRGGRFLPERRLRLAIVHPPREGAITIDAVPS